MRYMYDAIGANAASLKALKPDMVAIYLTGSGGIQWNSAGVAEITSVNPNCIFVRIDQGGATSPQYEATVFDSEPGAWTIANAVAATNKSTAARPTIYCDRSDYKSIPSSYTKDIWLAAPGLSDAEAEALAATDKRIVAVQNVWNSAWDRSVVVDPNWPEKKPVTPPPPPPPPVSKTDEVQIERYQDGFGWVLEQTFKTAPTAKYRFRVSNGTWSDWQEVTVP